MRHLFEKYKNRDFIFTIPLAAMALYITLGHIFWLLSSGRGLPQSDDSKWYIEYARGLLEHFSIGLGINDIMYFGYNMLLTLLLAIFKNTETIVIIQGAISGLSVILVYKIARMQFNRVTAFIAGLFYNLAWDNTLWSLYILSDSFFVNLLLLCTYLMLKALESGNKTQIVLFVLASLYMFFFRPTGIVAVAVMLGYILIRIDRKKLIDFVVHRWRPLSGVVVLLIVVFAGLSMANAFDPLIKSLQFNAKMVLYNVYARGRIYDLPTTNDYFFRPNYSIDIADSLILSFIINNWENVSVLYGKRALAFLGRWVWETNLYSLGGLVKVADRILPLALFIIGTVVAIANGIFKRTFIVWAIIFAIFAFCMLLFVDSMYRYRLPAVPYIAIVAAYGAERILYGVYVAVKKTIGMLFNERRKNPDCNSSL